MAIIKYQTNWGWQTDTIAERVKNHITNQNGIEAKVWTHAEAFGELVEMLYDNGSLTDKNIRSLCDVDYDAQIIK